MSVFRSFLLWCSENEWLKHNLPRYKFVKKAVKKFMPGELSSDALEAAKKLDSLNIPVVFTKLGENITSLLEAHETTEHYLKFIDDIESAGINGEISVKLTQIGFDLSIEETHKNIVRIIKKALPLNRIVWIDMEGSSYTETTVEFYERLKKVYTNVGLCIQAYLHRSEGDLNRLLKINANIRLVKGAYREPENVAIRNKPEIDSNYLKLSVMLLKHLKNNEIKAAFATHDMNLVNLIQAEALKLDSPADRYEIQMLYGIRTITQKQIASQGKKIRVLISYGQSWYAWYLRRLAERPANMLFVIKNIFK